MGIASMGVMRPELVMKSIIPVVMAGILGIYGLIIAVIISTGGTGCTFLTHAAAHIPLQWARATHSTRAMPTWAQGWLVDSLAWLPAWPLASWATRACGVLYHLMLL